MNNGSIEGVINTTAAVNNSNVIEPAAPVNKKLNIFMTPEMTSTLAKIPGVTIEKDFVKPPPDLVIDELREFYRTKTRAYPRDSNCEIIINMIAKTQNYPDDLYLGEIVTENGYEISLHPPNTLFYKALVWFYDTLPDARIWVGSLRVAGDYLSSYFAGILAYKANKPIRMFRLNNQNMNMLYSDPETPADIRDIILSIFGIGQPLEERVTQYQKPLFLKNEAECYDYAEISNYGVISPDTFRKNQHALISYIENRFNCNSTFLHPITGPFRACQSGEITIITSDIDIDYTNEFTWMNWGLKDIDLVKNFTINESYRNKNFKLVRWLKEHVNPIYEPCDVLSINVHMFVPVVAGQMFEEFILYVNKIKPKILCIQELPKSFAKRIAAQCHFDYYYTVSNGANNDDMKLGVFSKIKAKARILHKFYDKNRGMIILTINNKRLLFTHGPIGKSYVIRQIREQYIEKFYEAYKYNKQMRKKYINDIIKEKPHVIIGDLNLLPEEKFVYKFAGVGYKTFDETIPTSINDVKVDYVWTKLPGKQTVYNWIYSDHRPIGFTFGDPLNNAKIGGDGNINISVTMIIIAFVIVCLFMIIIIYRYYVTNYDDAIESEWMNTLIQKLFVRKIANT